VKCQTATKTLTLYYFLCNRSINNPETSTETNVDLLFRKQQVPVCVSSHKSTSFIYTEL